MTSHIEFDPKVPELRLLDQRFLPNEEKIFIARALDDVIYAIKHMVARGAPAIGVTAAFGCALALNEVEEAPDWRETFREKLARLAACRPTAVNLSWAVNRVAALCEGKSREELPALIWDEAFKIREEDIEICKKIGANGAVLVKDGNTVLTHCNAGALATAGYGTALGVIRAAKEAGKKVSVIADETRPLLQGARLTAWELARDNIPVKVACDNAVALLLSRGAAQLVIVGADRIAANGDTANKIGTYGVAIIARRFQTPFYVAAPLSTVDAALADGSQIPIERRDEDEIRIIGGSRMVPDGVAAYNFAFDVTPAELITGIITEAGVLYPPYTESIAKALNKDA